MKNENLTALAYHGFLSFHSQEKQIDLTPRLYTQRGEKIHLTFLPLRPDCGNDPQWEDWNCYRSILTIGWPDWERGLGALDTPCPGQLAKYDSRGIGLSPFNFGVD